MHLFRDGSHPAAAAGLSVADGADGVCEANIRGNHFGEFGDVMSLSWSRQPLSSSIWLHTNILTAVSHNESPQLGGRQE